MPTVEKWVIRELPDHQQFKSSTNLSLVLKTIASVRFREFLWQQQISASEIMLWNAAFVSLSMLAYLCLITRTCTNGFPHAVKQTFSFLAGLCFLHAVSFRPQNLLSEFENGDGSSGERHETGIAWTFIICMLISGLCSAVFARLRSANRHSPKYANLVSSGA